MISQWLSSLNMTWDECLFLTFAILWILVDIFLIITDIKIIGVEK